MRESRPITPDPFGFSREGAVGARAPQADLAAAGRPKRHSTRSLPRSASNVPFRPVLDR